jgi:hypothetical protein
VRFGVRHNIVKKTASQRGQGRQNGGVLRLSQELDDRLRNLTAQVTLNQATGEDLVRFACDLLSVDIDPPPAVELAGLRFDVPMQDAEPPFRDLVIALGRPEMPEHQAGWVLVRMLAEQMVANSIPPAIGAHQLWGLWWLCDQAPEIGAFVQLLDAWEETLEGQRGDIEAEMRGLAPAVVEAADRALAESSASQQGKPSTRR